MIDVRPVSVNIGFHKTAGKASTSGRWMSMAPDQAAQGLAAAIKEHRSCVYWYGRAVIGTTATQRILSRRWLIRLMGRNAEHAGYL